MQAMTHPIFWVQGEVQQDWRRLQQCTDQDTAVLAFERLLAQGRYDDLRLLKVERNAWDEPVDYMALLVYRSGERVSDADAAELTRTLRATVWRKRFFRALPQHAALAAIFVASVGLGVWVAAL